MCLHLRFTLKVTNLMCSTTQRVLTRMTLSSQMRTQCWGPRKLQVSIQMKVKNRQVRHLAPHHLLTNPLKPNLHLVVNQQVLQKILPRKMVVTREYQVQLLQPLDLFNLGNQLPQVVEKTLAPRMVV